MAIADNCEPLHPSEMKKKSELSRSSLWLDRAFPRGAHFHNGLCTLPDTLSICFLLFLHLDITYLGQNSRNYLYGSPLEFYENAAKHQELGATYPPPLYIILSIWLYPWKLANPRRWGSSHEKLATHRHRDAQSRT